ncbi:MAG: T9SS type A sorting domain-containing protein [Bacteroidetes bacterium]|nr:T9SS type A sorting domain-containing protein [Bacteroidota bacterium]
MNFNYSENTSVTISVFNLLGQDIIEERNLVVGNQSETIILPDTFRGIYFIRISSNKENVNKKFFKR